MANRLCLIGCHVLLCEDSLDIQKLVSVILKRAGASVSVASDGESGVEQILSAASIGNIFDVVLMDINMPVLDGLEATRRVRAQGYRGPIVAFTSMASHSDRRECFEAGCNGHLRKPVERQELLATVAHFAGQLHGRVSKC